MRTHLLTLVAALGLGACSTGSAVIGFTSYDVSYASGELTPYAPTRVVVRGTPFVDRNAETAAPLVVAAMQNGGFPPTQFSLDRVNLRSPYVVAALFGPYASIGDTRVCRLGPDNLALPPVAPANGDRIAVELVLCSSDDRVSAAVGSIDAMAADDPRFVKAMRTFLNSLLPPRNPDNDTGNGPDYPG